jgi:SAM-dependent methyltransferase
MPIEWFESRDKATPCMIRDLTRMDAAKVSFVGISHRKLVSDIIAPAALKRPLPWKELKICYASPEIGRRPEKLKYLENVQGARNSTLAVLSKMFVEGKLVARVCDMSMSRERHRFFGGCIIENEHGEPKVVYVVQYLPSEGWASENQVTFRIECPEKRKGDSATRSLLARYSSCFHHVLDTSEDMGPLEFSTAWVRSGPAWIRFEENSTVQKRSMEHVVLATVDLRGHESILDVGGGAGIVSQALLAHCRKLTLADVSPRLLEHAKEYLDARFAGKEVDVALCSGPTKVETKDDIDLLEWDRAPQASDWRLAPKRFDVIVSHFSLQHLLPDRLADRRKLHLGELATWFSKYLPPGGQVIIAAHNTVMNLRGGYQRETDPWRIAIVEAAGSSGLQAKAEEEVAPPLIEPQELIDAFRAKGYVHMHARASVREYEFEPAERRLLWKVPGVLNELVPVHQFRDQRSIDQFIDRAWRRLKNVTRLPRLVGYWNFRWEP